MNNGNAQEKPSDSAKSDVLKGFCVKCRAVRAMVNSVEGLSANKRRMLKGYCAKCNTKVVRFMPKKI
jgi:hypothetical protein